jgi:hypothetical protein
MRESKSMTSQLAIIIREREQKVTAIEWALEALRGIDGTGLPDVPTEKLASTRKGQKRSAATRRKMKASQQARWKRIRAEADKVPL